MAGTSRFVVEQLSWSGLGLTTGYLLGRVVCLMKGHHMSTGEHEHPELEPAHKGKDDRPPEVHLHTVRPGRARDTFVAILLVLFGVATLLSSTVAVVRAEAQAEARERTAICQERVNETFRRGLQDRVSAAAQDRMAITDLISEVARVQSDPGLLADPERRRVVFLEAITRYQASLKDAEGKRAASPLPGPNLCQ